MKRLLTLLAGFSMLTAVAQPTITSSFAPTATQQPDSGTYFTGAIGIEGAPGAAQTWDLRSLTQFNSFVTNYQDPALGLLHTTFPAATVGTVLGVDSPSYGYAALTGSVYQSLGSVNASAGGYSYYVYTRPDDVYHFPLTYQTHFEDDWQLKNFANNMQDTVLIVAQDTTIADGYGTLYTPSGLFTDVLRLHRHSVQVDYRVPTGGGSSSVQGNITQDDYTWISAAYPGTILALVTYTTGGGPGTPYGLYSKRAGAPTGLPDAHATGCQWAITPQPVSGTATLRVTTDRDMAASISITDIAGREVSVKTYTLITGTSTQYLDLTALSDGIYTVTLTTSTASSAQKLTVRH